MKKAKIGMIGLGVMGRNLACNMKSKGFDVAVYDLDTARADAMGADGFLACHTLEELAASLEKPRKIFMMVWAGNPVDELIGQLSDLLEEGDILIDGGNSYYKDTMRRCSLLEKRGLLYVGCGVSGGEEGALHGPSLMPGGPEAAWEVLRPILTAISAKTADGAPCVCRIGDNGAGHFVKMVHNGIEYGDMQLICEAYQILSEGLGLSNEELYEVFDSWNRTELKSYLIEITRDIFAYRDETGTYVLDTILDAAGQKGTGKWTVKEALDEGVPLTLIAEAVFSRGLSASKEARVQAAAVYPRERAHLAGDREHVIETVRRALYASKIISYAQGFSLLTATAGTQGWTLQPGEIARIWRGGCIIRSAFLNKIGEAFDRNPECGNLLLDEYFSEEMKKLIPSLREAAAGAALNGIPVPGFFSALAWFDGYTSERLPANLLQAQRDYFGAHTYERTDAPRGKHFHTNWTGRGGRTGSAVYTD